MSTRDEILEALTEHPAGLTLPELAKRCPSAEHDEQVVGGMLARLRVEGVLYNAEEPRTGWQVWVFGAPRTEPVNEPRLTFHAKPAAPGALISRPVAPRSTPAATQEPAMNLRAKIEAALKSDGPMTTRQMRAHVNDERIADCCHELLKQGALVSLGGGPRSTVYALPGQKAAPATPPAAVRNGSPSSRLREAMEALQAERAALLDKVQKVDRAIGALEALA